MADQRSRTKNSIRNASLSVLSQFLIIILGFVSRTVFVHYLGIEILGVYSVFTSVVALLSFADLGINGAIMFALYRPLKLQDEQKTATVIKYSERLYRRVALIVALLGICFVPFVRRVVNVESAAGVIEVYYLIMLITTVISYLMVSRVILLEADQRIHITKICSIIFDLVRTVAQIISLIVLADFVIYLLIQFIATIGKNAVIYFWVGRIYPFIRNSTVPLDSQEKKSLIDSVKAMAIFRVCGLILSHSPTLMISLIVGTATVGYYSNYMLIVTSVMMVTEAIFSAITPSIGNLVVQGDRNQSRRIFDEVVLLSTVLYGLASVGIFVFADNFIQVWLGNRMLLDEDVLVGIVVSFYITGSLMPLWAFRSATGLFKKTQWIMVVTVILSLLLSVSLGFAFGIVGIVLAPVLARLVTNAWYEPWMLFRQFLTGSFWSYILFQGILAMLWVLMAMFAKYFIGTIVADESVTFLIRVILIFLVYPIIIWAVLKSTSTYKSLSLRFKLVIGRKTRKGPSEKM